jgi:hypothetical protein
MSNHYGYIRRSEGADGDHVDTFLGDKPESEKVFIVDQVDPKSGKFDEHKVMLGFDSAAAAKAAYAAHYPAEWKGFQAISETTPDGLKAWLKSGAAKTPYADQPRFDRTQGGFEPTQNGSAAPVAAEHDRLLQPPAFEMRDRYGAREATAPEKEALTSALETLARAHGVPADRFSRITRLHVHDEMGGADGTWHYRTRSIGISAPLLRDVASGARPAHALAGVISHESWHAADESPHSYYSQEAPSFELAVDADGNRTPTGGIIKEAWKAYLTGAPILQRFLAYPLANINGTDTRMSDAQFTGMIQSEVFAQLGRLWDTNRGTLQRELPLAHSLFEEIHESAARGNPVGSAVQQALRARGADGKRGPATDAAPRARDQAPAGNLDRNARDGLGQDGRVQRGAEADAGGRASGSGGLQAAPGNAEGAGAAPLTGAPASSPGPNATARDAAAAYMKQAGLPYSPVTDYVTVDPARSARIADAYDAMPHAPDAGRQGLVPRDDRRDARAVAGDQEDRPQGRVHPRRRVAVSRAERALRRRARQQPPVGLPDRQWFRRHRVGARRHQRQPAARAHQREDQRPHSRPRTTSSASSTTTSATSRTASASAPTARRTRGARTRACTAISRARP